MILKSDFLNASLEINYEGEHHMGAMSITFFLDRKFRGISKFRSTNGQACFDKNGPFLILYDAVIILIFDYKKNEVYHLLPEKGEFFKTASLSNGVLSYRVNSPNGGSSKKYSLDLYQDKKNQGYGKVANGKMPSAYP